MLMHRVIAAGLLLASLMAMASVNPLPVPRHDFLTAGAVTVIRKDALGRIWLAGNFIEVDGQPRSNIVRLLADGSVDQTFNCAVDGIVRAIVFDNSNRAYIGGSFLTVNGQAKARLARVSADCVLDSGFPSTAGPNASVFALALNASGDAIYVGGSMNQPKLRLARYSTVSGALEPGFGFAFNTSGIVLALASDGAEGVYVGGSFPAISSQTAYARLAHLEYDVVNGVGSIDTNFPAAVDNNVLSLLVTADSVFAGGSFNNVAGSPRPRLARIQRSNGSLVSAFQPTPNGAVRAIAQLSSTELLIAGGFDKVGNRLTGSVAKISIATGDAALLQADSDAPINCMLLDGTIAHVGGAASMLAGQPRAGYGAFDFSSGVSLVAEADAEVLSPGGALSHWRDPDGSVWVGGSFLKVDGQAMAGLLRLTPNDQIDTSVNANVRGRRAVFAMTRDASGRLYFGGELERIGNQARAGLGRLLANNTVDTSFSFKLGPRAGQLDVTVFKLLVEGSYLYVLGDFGDIQDPSGAVTNSAGLVKIDLQTNTVETSFNPVLDFLSPDILALQAIAMDPVNRRLYIGGSLAAVDGTPRNRLAAIHMDTGELITSFAPAIEGANAEVWELALDQAANHLYVGGVSIASVNGNSSAGPFFRVFANTGALDQSWMVGFGPNDAVETIALDNQNHVFVGGNLFAPSGFSEGSGAYRLRRDATTDLFDLEFSPNAVSPYQFSYQPSNRTLMVTGGQVSSPSTTWLGLAVLPEQGGVFRDSFEGP